MSYILSMQFKHHPPRAAGLGAGCARGSALLIVVLTFVGCAQEPAATTFASDASVSYLDVSATTDVLDATGCPMNARKVKGGCAAVGPQTCVAAFVDPTDGLCKPSLLDCPAGTVPKMDEGCVPVGVPECAPEFINDETGQCDPNLSACGAHQVFKLSEGCVDVGIPGCDPVFINPDTGLCDPRLDQCAPGEIPVFESGCEAIGVSVCAPMFLNESGHCVPDANLCPQGEMPLIAQGCVSIDGPLGCGEGTWGAIVEAPGDVHVDGSHKGATADGSRDAPYTTLTQALDMVETGGRIVVAAGLYEEGLLIERSMTIVGRCASMVTLAPTDVLDTGGGIVVANVTGFVLEGVTLTNNDALVANMIVTNGAEVTVRRSVIGSNDTANVAATEPGTSLTLERCVLGGGAVTALAKVVVMNGAEAMVRGAAQVA